MHTILPGMLTKNGWAVMPFGVMGGHFQPMGQNWFLTNFLEYGLDIQQSLNLPRIFSFAGKVVATYELFNMSRTRLENLIYRVFGPARLDIEIKDRFGQPVAPREWFLVPLFIIDEAVERFRDGTITGFVYDSKLQHVAA